MFTSTLVTRQVSEFGVMSFPFECMNPLFIDEPGIAVEPSGPEEENKGLMDKIGEGIKKLF
jgi:hypothetical protein